MSPDDVVQVVNMSASYFNEKFKEMTGINFVEYVTRTRVEKARNLLLNPNRSVSEVAFEVGFQSLSQFNRAFRKVVGEAPRDYRAELPVGRSLSGRWRAPGTIPTRLHQVRRKVRLHLRRT